VNRARCRPDNRARGRSRRRARHARGADGPQGHLRRTLPSSAPRGGTRPVLAMEQTPEHHEGNSRDAALVGFIWTYVRPYRGLFLLSVLLMPVNSAFALAQPYVIQLIIDLFLAHRRMPPPPWLAAIFRATGGPGLLKMGVIYLFLVGGEFAAAYGQFYLTMMVAQYSLSDLRLALFDRVQRLPMSFFDRTPIGRLVSRMTTDIVVIMWLRSPRLAMWSLVAFPPLLLFINLFRVRARIVYRQIRERLAAVNAYLSEALAGMTVVQLFTHERASRAE